MFLEVDPGDGKPLPKDGRIPVSNTLPDIDPDEFLAALDGDTRNYLKLLISGAGKGLEGRGTDLRATLERLGPLHRDLARVSRAVAERRQNMRRLVNRYGLLMTELGKSDKDITRLVRSSNTTLGAFADEDQNISSLVSKLPGTLNQTASTLGKVDTLARPDGPDLPVAPGPVQQARRGERGRAAVRQGGRADPPEAGAAVRARRAAVPARPGCRVQGPRRGEPGPDDGLPRPQPAVRHRRLQPRRHRRASPRAARRQAPARRRSAPETRATSTGSRGSARTPCRCSRPPMRSARSGAPTCST